MYEKNEIQRENKEHQSRKKKMRACHKFVVAEQRSDPPDCEGDQLRKAQVEDISMKSVWESAQESDVYIL